MGRAEAGGAGSWIPAGADAFALQRAEAVVDNLAAGRQVDPEALEAARDALVDLLGSGELAAANRARSGLLAIDGASASPEERAELLGEAMALGEARGGPLFESLLAQGAGEMFSEEELEALRASLGAPPVQRLETIATWLGSARADAPDPDRQEPLPSPANRNTTQPVVESRRRAAEEEKTRHQPKVEGDGDGDRDLWNPSLDTSLRLQEALDLGRGAIPPLSELLRGDDREFATVALIHLGRNADHGREVYRLALRLELDPDTRPMGEMIRRGLEQSAGVGEDANNPTGSAPRSGTEEVGDLWLRQALEACDTPNLLMAAVGREAAVIPRALRRLVEVRTARHSRPTWRTSSTGGT